MRGNLFFSFLLVIYQTDNLGYGRILIFFSLRSGRVQILFLCWDPVGTESIFKFKIQSEPNFK